MTAVHEHLIRDSVGQLLRDARASRRAHRGRRNRDTGR
jgi:hypothetical protein